MKYNKTGIKTNISENGGTKLFNCNYDPNSRISCFLDNVKAYKALSKIQQCYRKIKLSTINIPLNYMMYKNAY